MIGKVFINEDFGEIKAMYICREPWFVAKDVVPLLGYTDTMDALSKYVDDEDKHIVANFNGTQDDPDRTIINISGLYSLILSSKLPNAKKFKRWVTSEILPAIRNYGGSILLNNQEEIAQKSKQIADIKIGNEKRILELYSGPMKLNEDGTFSEFSISELTNRSNAEDAYFNSKKNRVPKLIYHDKNEK